MTPLRLILCVFIVFSIGEAAVAQLLSGKVIDTHTKEPLPFVNITVIGKRTGATTDVDGKFQLAINELSDQQAEISFVGYHKRILPLADFRQGMLISLERSTTQLSEIVIHAGENPAHRIIRQAVKNRELNDPAQLESYSFNAYNKTVFTLEGVDNEAAVISDTLDRAMRYGHLFLTESYTKVKHRSPSFDEETVLLNKFSGLEDPKLAMLSSSFQPFSFYESQVDLFGTLYINPISDRSTHRYDFEIVDTVLNNYDTTFIIAYQPLRKIEHKTLKGLLYINTDKFAIESIIASPADTTMKLDFRIQQKYERAEKRWFPKQLYTRYMLKDYTLGKKPMVVRNQSYFSNIAINPFIDKKEFGLLNVQFKPDKELLLPDIRPDSLSRRERQTYFNYDTLNAKTKRILNGVMNLGIDLASGRFPLGKLDLLPRHLFRINQYEKFGLGIGLTTNDKVSSVARLEGYAAFSFGDMALKYGGGLQFRFEGKHDHNIYFRYSRDVSEPGTVDFYSDNSLDISSGAEQFRKMFASRMDSVERFTVEYNARPMRYWHTSVFASVENRNPAYHYEFVNGRDDMRFSYHTTEMGLKFRFLFKEQLTQVGKLKVISGNAFPYITGRISKAFADVEGSHLDFIRADVRFKHVINSAALGKTYITLNAGKVWGNDIPYSFLNTGNAMKSDQLGISMYVPGLFHTMRMYEFASDQYAYLSVAQNTGPLFSIAKGAVRPELILVQNTGYGSLRNPDQHQGVEFKTMENGFFETGAMINNIFRKDLKLYRAGLGGGAFYRYGPYALSSTRDNIVFIVSTTITF